MKERTENIKFKFYSKCLFVILSLVLAIFLAGCGGLITPATDEAEIKAELLQVEVVAELNDIIVVQQGQTVNFNIKLSAPTGQFDSSYTSSNPATALIPTSYSIGSSGAVSTGSPSSEHSFWWTPTYNPQGNPTPGPATWTNYPTPYSVPATASATLDAPTGDYIITIVPTLSNPGGNPRLTNNSSDTLTIRVVAATPSDTTPPVGSITINNDALYTKITGVTLNLAATDAVGVTRYRVANGTDASGGTVVAVTSTTSFSADTSWTLPTGDGTKTVAVQYGDAVNWSADYTDSIILDQSAPVITAGTPTGTPGLDGWWVSAVTVPFSATDNLSGFTPDGALSIDLVSKTTVGEGAALSVTSDGISDRAGNSAVGIQAGPFKVDWTPPVVTITAPTDGGYYKTADLPTLAYSVVEVNTYTIATTDYATTEGEHTVTVTATDAAGNEGEASVTYTVDNTPPATEEELDGSEGKNDWWTSDVEVTLTATDNVGGSGVKEIHYILNGVETVDSGDTATFTIATEGTNSLDYWAVDNAGNEEEANSLDIKIDKTNPVVIINAPTDGAEYTLGQTVLADWTATDALSGIASAVGTVDSGLAIETGTVGSKDFEVTATDNAGNTTTVTVTYSVIYDWDGFFSPVDNLPTQNVAKAGSAIPVKFSLSGYQGPDIFATGYPKSSVIKCDSTAPVDGIELTVTAGGSSLNYDAAADQYIYVWKTEKVWANTCRQLVVLLIDGTYHRANFSFKK